jgi:hypothetical protein
VDLLIDNVRKATDEEWDSLWEQCDYATYFHSRHWSEIWCEYSRGKIVPEPKMVYFSDDKIALIPFSASKGLLKTYFSSPAGTFGGWISADDLGGQHINLLTKHMLHCNGALHWRMNPYSPFYGAIHAGRCREDVTHALGLLRGFDEIVKGWSKGHKSAANKARREGVTTRLAKTEVDWVAYYHMYEHSLARWGRNASSRYPWRFFEIVRKTNSDKIRLWLADYNGRAIAGALCLYARKHVVYWHGAALSEFFNLRPVHLLLYDVIRDAVDYGAHWFDFNPSGGHEGVLRFKEGFGTEQIGCSVCYRHTWATYLHDEGVKNYARIWKLLKLIGNIKGLARAMDMRISQRKE